MKSFVKSLAANGKYSPVAIHFMEVSGPVHEYMGAVGDAYGINYETSTAEERRAARKAYWDHVRGLKERVT